MSDLFSLIPFKLLFLGCTIYLWKRLFNFNRSHHSGGINYWALGFALLSIALAIISVGKLYPYGIVSDLLVFALACTWIMALPLNRLGGQIAAIVILATVLLGPLTYLSHYQVVGGAMDKDSLIAIFQTNHAEALEYLASFTSAASIAPLVLSAVFVIWLIRRMNTPQREVLPSRAAIALSLAALAMLALAPLERGLFTYPIHTFVAYKKDMEQMRERIAHYNDREIEEYSVSKSGQGEVYLVVIGESQNKHHMGIYGYGKDTTPHMEKLKAAGELLVVNNSFSNYPRTIPALSHALTQANQKNDKDYIDSVGLIALMNEADFDTHWIGNQPLSTSYDMALGFIAKEADHLTLTFDAKFTSTNKDAQKPDGVLLPHIQKALDERDADKNLIIFVHLSGNHTDYCKRYPAEYARYEVPASKAFWMHLVRGGPGRSEECYDNSILYNDFIVDSIVNQVRTTLGDSNIGAVMYFADHADDIEQGGHSRANFTFQMVDSPAMVWLSPAYKRTHQQRFSALRNNLNEYYPNDFMFDTVIGMTGLNVSSNVYCADCDLFNPAYRLPLSEARTMHGRMQYQPPVMDKHEQVAHQNAEAKSAEADSGNTLLN